MRTLYYLKLIISLRGVKAILFDDDVEILSENLNDLNIAIIAFKGIYVKRRDSSLIWIGAMC